jgi:hypothetical protein
MASTGATGATAAQSVSHGNSTKAASSAYQNEATQHYLDMLNKTLGQNYLWALFGVAAMVFAYTIAVRINSHIRHLASMNSQGALRYFSKASPLHAFLKSHLFYAPILYYRRAREMKFSRLVNFGGLPARGQAVFILLVVVANFFASTWNIPWSHSQLQVLPILRNRTGTLSVVNLIPITIMATVKNPLITLLDIPYDTFNLLHRWFGRLAILQAIAHTLCYIIGKVQSNGWAGVKEALRSPFMYCGLVATIAVTLILVQSIKPLRSLSYEVFHHLHIVLVLVTMVFLWKHLHLDKLPQQHSLIAAASVWGAARALRFATLLFRSVGEGVSKAKVYPMPGGAVKINITTPRPWVFRPGQSLYLAIPSLGLWTAHPFSVAWSGLEEPLSPRCGSVKSDFSEKKGPLVHSKVIDLEVPAQQTMSLIVKRQTGGTRKLWERAMQSDMALSYTAFIEGPYGPERSLASYGMVMLFASGVGITHQLPYVKDLVEGYRQGTVAAKRVTLVWVIPNTECLEWVQPWMHEILGMDGRREILRILLYITREGLGQSIRSPSEMVRMSRGRPDVQTLMWNEAEQKAGCLGVGVCAGGGLADEVRRVSRLMLDRGANLDLIEEGFGW